MVAHKRESSSGRAPPGSKKKTAVKPRNLEKPYACNKCGYWPKKGHDCPYKNYLVPPNDFSPKLEMRVLCIAPTAKRSSQEKSCSRSGCKNEQEDIPTGSYHCKRCGELKKDHICRPRNERSSEAVVGLPPTGDPNVCEPAVIASPDEEVDSNDWSLVVDALNDVVSSTTKIWLKVSFQRTHNFCSETVF